jgi:phage baseplate assembly protein W
MATTSTPINFTFPMKRSSVGGFATNSTTLDAVESDLKILILSNFGDRPIHYDFGANLRGAIFEHQGNILRQVIKDLIVTAVEKWMPFCNILNVEVQDSTVNNLLGPNEINVKIEFSVGNIDVTRIFKQKIRA